MNLPAFFASAAFLLLGLGIGSAAEPEFRHRTNVIEGWTVLVNRQLAATNGASTDRALELLRVQLQEIIRVVPAPAVARLREVRLWFSPEYPGVPPGAEYHPGADWLREHGRDPAMAKGVEFTNIRIFAAETRRMPNFTLHELAHSFHDRVLPGGFDNPAIQAAYEKAKAAMYEWCSRLIALRRSRGTLGEDVLGQLMRATSTAFPTPSCTSATSCCRS